jgi:Rieske Fe-S protein
LATGLAAVLPERGAAAADPAAAKKPPQPGDEFVFVKGAKKGQTVTVADLAETGTLLEAWPKDPATDTVRNRSRLNRVLLLRLDPGNLDERTAERAAEGIVAYSAFCTHAGCFIERLLPEDQVIFCHCHDSRFDPRASGRVVGGPAKAPLAGLPIEVKDGLVLVAGEFQGKLGVPKA